MKTSNTIKIRTALEKDLEKIIKIENEIERYPASYETLLSRLKMFNEGFLVAETNNEIVGYIESCLWKTKLFESFEEIKNFPELHNPLGDTLYVIFIAVDPKYQHQGIGSKLISSIIEIANTKKVEKVQLVAKVGLENFYKKFGFIEVRTLPNFLYGEKGILMEKYLERCKKK